MNNRNQSDNLIILQVVPRCIGQLFSIRPHNFIPDIPVESVVSESFLMMEIVISRTIPPFPEPVLLSIRRKYIIPEMPEDIVGGHPRPKYENSYGMYWEDIDCCYEYTRRNESF